MSSPLGQQHQVKASVCQKLAEGGSTVLLDVWKALGNGPQREWLICYDGLPIHLTALSTQAMSQVKRSLIQP